MSQVEPSAAPAGGRLNILLSDSSGSEQSWAERLPTLLEPMGVRSHVAASGRQATELLSTTTIHVAVVDLGLPLDHAASPDAPAPSAGWRLLEVLARLSHRPPTVAVKQARTRRDEARELAAALRLGAFAVVDRPRSTRDMETLLEVLRRCIARHYRGRWPG
ncbi:MAG: hypothetical protein ACTS22_08650 [Phycisphaerales bacterium]